MPQIDDPNIPAEQEPPADRPHVGLPVYGYQPQSDGRIALVNANKALEERVLRQIDSHRGANEIDQRMVALAHTKVQEAFMWLNRAVFQPARISLPEDE